MSGASRAAASPGPSAPEAASRKTATTSPMRCDWGDRRSTSTPAAPRLVEDGDEALHAGRLRLHAVQHEEVLLVLRVEGQAVGVLDAAELAVVLREVVVARREAARRHRERQPPVGEDLGLDAGRGIGHDGRDAFARELHRRHPARRAQLRQQRRACPRCRRSGTGRRRTAPLPASARTAAMSFASTRKAPFSTTACIARRSASLSISSKVDSTTSLPARARSSPMAIQSASFSSRRREQTVSPR